MTDPLLPIEHLSTSFATENGPLRAVVCASPQHPYTEALMRSTPLLGMRHSGHELHSIRGQVPGLIDLAAGCRFRSRRDYAFWLCSDQPDLFPVRSQNSACWLCQHGPREAPAPLTGAASGEAA